MTIPIHKVFISYHHDNDQIYKDQLVNAGIFIDASVHIGDIDDRLNDQQIRQKIRDEYLRDSTVTIVLVGTETKNRKHIDWEIYSSMYDGQVNKRSGILVINLPTTNCEYVRTGHGESEKELLYPNINNWHSITRRTEFENRYPFMPSRIIDNLLQSKVKISITNWSYICCDFEKLKHLIDLTFNDRLNCNYDLSTPMRRSNS